MGLWSFILHEIVLCLILQRSSRTLNSEYCRSITAQILSYFGRFGEICIRFIYQLFFLTFVCQNCWLYLAPSEDNGDLTNAKTCKVACHKVCEGLNSRKMLYRAKALDYRLNEL